MNKKKISVLLFAILTAGYVQAQFTIGAQAGLNLTNVSMKYDGGKDDALNPKYKCGFRIGVVGEYDISKNFSIQSGILYAIQGYKLGPSEISTDDIFDIQGWEQLVTVNISYLQIPVNAQYLIDFGGSVLLFQAGPYFGYAFGGKTKLECFQNGNEVASIKEKTYLAFGNKEDQLSPFDFGLGMGIGLQLDAVQIGLKYNLGLANLYNIEKTTMNNRGFAIVVTYFFNKK